MNSIPTHVFEPLLAFMGMSIPILSLISGAFPIHVPHFMVVIRWIVRLDAAVWNLKELTVRPVNLRYPKL